MTTREKDINLKNVSYSILKTLRWKQNTNS